MITLFHATLFMTLLLVAGIGYVLVRFVPIIERNAFEVPRYQMPQSYEPPPSLKMQRLNIPYDTKSVVEACYIPNTSGQASVHSRETSKRLVVFCHETGADMNSWYRHAHFLPEDGVDVLAFNFKPRPIKQSKHVEDTFYQWPSFRELKVLERVLSWVAAEKEDFEVALFGVSKGATVAIAAAPSPLIRSVLLDGAFSTHLTMSQYMKKWVNIYVSSKKVARQIPNGIYIFLSYATLVYASFRKHVQFFSIEHFITRLRKPVFWIHAGKDYHVRLEHVEFLRRRIPGTTDLWVAEKAGHSDAVDIYPHEYRSKIVNFLGKTLA